MHVNPTKLTIIFLLLGTSRDKWHSCNMQVLLVWLLFWRPHLQCPTYQQLSTSNLEKHRFSIHNHYSRTTKYLKNIRHWRLLSRKSLHNKDNWKRYHYTRKTTSEPWLQWHWCPQLKRKQAHLKKFVYFENVNSRIRAN